MRLVTQSPRSVVALLVFAALLTTGQLAHAQTNYDWSFGNASWTKTEFVGSVGSVPLSKLWNNSTTPSNIATFNGTSGAITVVPGINIGRLNVDVAGYTFSGGDLTLLTGTGTTSITTPTISVASGIATTISSTLMGTVGFDKIGTGTLILNGTNTISGTVTVSAGTLQVGNGVTSGTLGTVAVTNNAALAFNRSDSLTVANAISGTGTLNQAGTGGTTILTATNTYTGTTTVSAGTLQVNGSIASGSAVTVVGGTLGGTGTVNGAVTVNSGGTVRGGTGTGTGTLTVGNTTVNSGGVLAANIAASGTNSTLALNGNTLNLVSGSKLVLTPLAGFTNATAGSYTIATLNSGSNLQLDGNGASTNTFGTFIQGTGNTGAVKIDVSNLSFALNTGDTFNLTRTGNNLILSFTPVPEPATVLGVSAAALGLAGWVRRRRGRPATN